MRPAHAGRSTTSSAAQEPRPCREPPSGPSRQARRRDRRRARRLLGGVPGRRPRPRGGAGRALRAARRRLPERRLHSLEGAAARRPGDREAEEAKGFGISFGEPEIDLDALRGWKEEVVGKLTGGLASARQAAQGRGVTGEVAKFTLRHRDRRRRHRDRLRPLHHRRRLARRRASRPSRGRADRRLDRRARARRDTRAPAGRRRRDHRARDGDRLRRARQQGERGRADRRADPRLRPRPRRSRSRSGSRRATRRSCSRPRSAGIEATEEGLEVIVRGRAAPRAADLRPRPRRGRPARQRRPARARRERASRSASDGVIAVDEQRRTNVPHIYAIGDIAGEPMLAHKADHEGRVAAEVIAGEDVAFDRAAIPSVAYTDPEIAWTGLDRDGGEGTGIDYEVASSPGPPRAGRSPPLAPRASRSSSSIPRAAGCSAPGSSASTPAS